MRAQPPLCDLRESKLPATIYRASPGMVAHIQTLHCLRNLRLFAETTQAGAEALGNRMDVLGRDMEKRVDCHVRTVAGWLLQLVGWLLQ